MLAVLGNEADEEEQLSSDKVSTQSLVLIMGLPQEMPGLKKVQMADAKISWHAHNPKRAGTLNLYSKSTTVREAVYRGAKLHDVDFDFLKTYLTVKCPEGIVWVKDDAEKASPPELKMGVCILQMPKPGFSLQSLWTSKSKQIRNTSWLFQTNLNVAYGSTLGKRKRVSCSDASAEHYLQELERLTRENYALQEELRRVRRK